MIKTPLIRLEGITFRYEEKEIFKGLNFELFEGERVGIIGPNGIGKTTLLYLIMGFLKPKNGKIEILGKLRVKERDFYEVRQKIGLLFQDADSQLFCPTVKEDILFGPLNLGKDKKTALILMERALHLLGLKGYEDRITYKLSGGEKKLIALATVIAMEPLCYLLDEPTAGLDEENKKRVLNFLKTMASTYLITSHDRFYKFSYR